MAIRSNDTTFVSGRAQTGGCSQVGVVSTGLLLEPLTLRLASPSSLCRSRTASMPTPILSATM